MTDDRAQVQPDAGQITAPFHPRGTYAGYRAFGSGDGAVLVEPGLAHQLRSAAELATSEQRCTGGLVFGRRWADDQGAYLVVSGFAEAGPGANSGDQVPADSRDDFALSAAELRLLREDAAAMYPASYEVGWWRTLAALGEFGPGDLATQAELAGPDSAGQEGVGLLVYGSGIHWGTAYLGPDGRAPDSAGTLVITPGLEAEAPTIPEPALEPDPLAGPEAVPEPVPEPVPERGPDVVDFAAGESMLEEDPPPAANVPPEGAVPGTAAPGRARRRVRQAGQGRQRASSRVRVPTRARGRARAGRLVGTGYPDDGDQFEGYPGRELPLDYQLVIIALALAAVAAAVIVGVIAHSVTVGVIIAAVALLGIFSTVWMSRYHS